jgi:hypothetical protein
VRTYRSAELLVARHVVGRDLDRLLERLGGVVDLALRQRDDRRELLQLRIVGLVGDRLLDPRERLVALAHLLLDLEQTAQDVGMVGPLLERLEQEIARLLVLALRGVDAPEREVDGLVALVLGIWFTSASASSSRPSSTRLCATRTRVSTASGFCCR